MPPSIKNLLTLFDVRAASLFCLILSPAVNMNGCRFPMPWSNFMEWLASQRPNIPEIIEASHIDAPNSMVNRMNAMSAGAF